MPLKSLRVLIVDDDREFRDRAAEVLSEARYSVAAFGDAGGAAEALRRWRGRAVVLSGLAVGGESGLDLLDGIRKRYPHVPFTFVADSPGLDMVIDALKRGAYDFLRKPVDPGILRHSVARSVEKLNLSLEGEGHEKEIRRLLSESRQQLKESRNLGSFQEFLISTAAHDLRSVLTVLDGYHQIIKDRCEDCGTPEIAALLHQARRSIHRLRNMTSVLLDFHAAERGALEVRSRRFDLGKLLRSAADFYRPYAQQKRVDLDVDDDMPPLEAVGDPERVEQVLDNILYNAVKFTPQGGRIRIGAVPPQAGEVRVWVKDTGPGIPRDVAKKIMDGREIVRKRDGSARVGLGLNICRRLLEIQKGKLWVESGTGKGTKVHFSLPA